MKSKTMNIPSPSYSEEHHLRDNQSRQQNPRANGLRLDVLHERVASLEQELARTRLELARAKSSEDKLKLKVAKKISALHEITVNNRRVIPFGPNACAGGDENRQENATPRINAIPTANPFSRKKRTSALNPGSCASALNLMGLASQGSMPTPHRAINRAVLDPSYCALGLNLMGLSTALADSPSQLRLDQDTTGPPPSSTRKVGSLLGYPRLFSNSSFGRCNNKKMRHNSRNTLGGGNRNEDWGHFD